MEKTQGLGGIQLKKLTAKKFVESWPSLDSKRLSKWKVETIDQKMKKEYFIEFLNVQWKNVWK